MPTREQTIADAVEILEHAEYPSGLSVSTVWLGIYQTLLWYEPIDWLGYEVLPHIIDSDKLRPSSPVKRSSWTKPNVWQKRAALLSAYLAEQLGCSTDNVAEKVNLLMKRPDYEGMQRQNTLGIAFAGVVKYALERFGASAMSYETEVEASTVFAGITIPGRSSNPRIDLLAKHHGIPRAIISAKWSVRHDRVGDITSECPAYKSGYERIYRRGRRDPGLLYYVVTNEYDPARLSKLLDDSCIDGTVHVHKAAVVDVCGLDRRLTELIDLKDFVNAASTW